MKPGRVLEVCLYTSDLDAAEQFYTNVLGLQVYGKAAGRHVFFKLQDQMLLIFNPDVTREGSAAEARLPVPPHGADGPVHVCFRASGEEIAQWVSRLDGHGVALEADFEWPGGGRSIYFRDPAGHCLEFAEAKIWGLA